MANTVPCNPEEYLATHRLYCFISVLKIVHEIQHDPHFIDQGAEVVEVCVICPDVTLVVSGELGLECKSLSPKSICSFHLSGQNNSQPVFRKSPGPYSDFTNGHVTSCPRGACVKFSLLRTHALMPAMSVAGAGPGRWKPEDRTIIAFLWGSQVVNRVGSGVRSGLVPQERGEGRGGGRTRISLCSKRLACLLEPGHTAGRPTRFIVTGATCISGALASQVSSPHVS